MSQCLLCDFEGPDVTVAMVRFRPGQAPPGRLFDQMPRCKDHVACRRRVEADGITWPVDERSSAAIADDDRARRLAEATR